MVCIYVVLAPRPLCSKSCVFSKSRLSSSARICNDTDPSVALEPVFRKRAEFSIATRVLDILAGILYFSTILPRFSQGSNQRPSFSGHAVFITRCLEESKTTPRLKPKLCSDQAFVLSEGTQRCQPHRMVVRNIYHIFQEQNGSFRNTRQRSIFFAQKRTRTDRKSVV